MKKLLPLLSALVLLASCNQYQKTPSGIAYKISGNSKAPKPQKRPGASECQFNF
jgi:hypothetical protein